MRAIAASLLSAVALAGTAAASSLGVAPVRVELSSATNTAALTVRNQGDSPIVVQVRPTAWSQRDEQDQLDDTHELLATPPLFTVPAKGQQVVRIALQRKADASRELAYRLVLSEVPPEAGADATAVRIALRLTLPVFVAAQVRALPDLSWQHTWLPDGTLQIQAQNHGTAHIQILDFDASSADGRAKALHTDTMRYLLPGSGANWLLHASGGTSAAPSILIHGHSDVGDFTVTSASSAR